MYRKARTPAYCIQPYLYLSTVAGPYPGRSICMVLLVHGLPCILLDVHDKSTFQRLEALTLHFATFGHRPGAAGRLSILEHVSLNSIVAGAGISACYPTQCLSTRKSHLQTLALRETGSSSRAQNSVKAVSLR